MGIGGCIILIAVGAVITFATDWHAKGVNMDLLGLIMMAVGVIGMAAYVSIFKRRRIPPTADGDVPPVVEERYYTDRRL
ncbi:hypothetical protein [Actinacidiphila bryophytorum]|uniref:Uncharacterized protein n=1 Tax=Actinacidiphila bryophytorum TaxID=1436133 RepID=A0A9W4H5G3_9ACTN|nr:hypothetical protein [Actinacidiphila bryophytorum]MBM9437409.1 hypothetical protein [Actinacidiphila bryophytorum]MBN6545920.1 hypothetical protein [Actinacidiphila bryophytorum]UWE07361.1 hypothetical protein NYE86_00505 [Actinacidiphila bryophytorum]CAG7651995.1 conserved hypothetical protein [Actinacidiphila bryophytorum]